MNRVSAAKCLWRKSLRPAPPIRRLIGVGLPVMPPAKKACRVPARPASRSPLNIMPSLCSLAPNPATSGVIVPPTAPRGGPGLPLRGAGIRPRRSGSRSRPRSAYPPASLSIGPRRAMLSGRRCASPARPPPLGAPRHGAARRPPPRSPSFVGRGRRDKPCDSQSNQHNTYRT